MTEPYEAVTVLLEETSQLMEDLFQSGFDTVHDSTLAALENETKKAREYGMDYLSGLLNSLWEGLSRRRHQLEKPRDHMAEIYAKINQYLNLCMQKASQDKAWEYYGKEHEEK